MNRHFFKINSFFKTLIAAGFITTLSLPVSANKRNIPVEVSGNIQPSVQYISSEKSGDLYAVKFDSETPVAFKLVIKDALGDNIYSQDFKAAGFSKIFKLINEEGDNSADLYFSIELENGKSYNFTVSKTAMLVKDVQITKI